MKKQKFGDLEAVLLTRDNFHEVGEWAGAEECWGLHAPIPRIFLKQGADTQHADIGDWVVRGLAWGPGEFHSVAADSFPSLAVMYAKPKETQ